MSCSVLSVRLSRAATEPSMCGYGGVLLARLGSRQWIGRVHDNRTAHTVSLLCTALATVAHKRQSCVRHTFRDHLVPTTLIKGVKNPNSLRPIISSHSNLSKLVVSKRRSIMTTAMPQVARVVVRPLSCLHDESISLRVDGLAPGEEVTLKASMTDTRGVLFMSLAHYRADDHGQVDVSTMESLGGSYRGVFPMGLLSSLSPALDKNKFVQFYKRDVENPNTVTISVFQGHHSNEELLGEDRNEPLATATHFRHYMASGVKRIPVRYGKVRGCFFLPPGDGPFPGVVDMYGSGGGLLEHRSALLASRGIASLALAYFWYDDLPKSLEEFNISYFEEAVEFLLKHEKVKKPNVGVVGTSKGGDMALSISTFIPEVTAVVCFNGGISNSYSRLNLHNSTLPALPHDCGKMKMVDGAMDCYEVLDHPKKHPETIIPIEQADAKFLFLVSLNDRNWKSEMYAELAIERLRLAGKTNYTVHKYPGAGHLVEPPYTPFCSASYHKLVGTGILMGGILRPHADAQVQAWDACLTFIYKHLGDQNL